MAKIAGTLSTAKTRSARLMITNASSNGVAQTTMRPVTGSGRRTRNFWPCSVGVTRMRFVMKRTIGLRETSVSLSFTASILMPVAIRKAPNR